MQEAGRVLHLARSGRLIIRAAIQVQDNTILVDENGRKICKVNEMIGPVSSPYFSAQPLKDRIERTVGSTLYLSEQRQELGRQFRSRVRKNKRRSRNPQHK